jgi:acetate kinase
MDAILIVNPESSSVKFEVFEAGKAGDLKRLIKRQTIALHYAGSNVRALRQIN